MDDPEWTMTTHHVPKRRVLRRSPPRSLPRRVLFEDDEIDVDIIGLGYEADDRDGATPSK
jgi:hypothetical protein